MLVAHSHHLAFFHHAQRARRVQGMLIREVSHTFQMKISDRRTSVPQAEGGKKKKDLPLCPIDLRVHMSRSGRRRNPEWSMND